MARVRRPRYLCFFCNDQPFPDVERLLSGEVAASTLRQLYALSILTGEEVPLTGEELEYVLSTPSDRWVEAGELEESFVLRLMEHGVLLSDDGDERLAALRRRDEELTETQWNLYGALYFFLTRWSHVDLRVLSGQDETGDLLAPTGEIIRRFLDAYGDPPAPFRPAANGPARVDLPVVNQQGELYDVLARRRTTRRFESDVPLPIEELSVVLRYVFGYHGYAPLFGQVMTLKRTSPSGGGLHPVEAYPLIRNVEGIEPGLYHYDARDHALERIAGMSGAEAGAAATDFVCGQTYFSAAHALIVLAARFERAFWKYRKHQRGLASVLMDAAHLSQTLYLVAAERGLGAFITAAVNNADIDAALGLDGVHEGTLAVCGFGKAADEPSPFDPAFKPFVPRETELG